MAETKMKQETSDSVSDSGESYEEVTEAKRILLEMYGDNHSDLRVLNALAIVCEELQQFKEAITWYTKYNEHNKNAAIYKRIGYLHATKLQNYESAQKMYKEALSMNGLDDDCIFLYAQLLAILKQSNDARTHFERSIRIKTSANKHFHFAHLLFTHFGDIDAAMIELEKAMDLEPKNEKYANKYNDYQRIKENENAENGEKNGRIQCWSYANNKDEKLNLMSHQSNTHCIIYYDASVACSEHIMGEIEDEIHRKMDENHVKIEWKLYVAKKKRAKSIRKWMEGIQQSLHDRIKVISIANKAGHNGNALSTQMIIDILLNLYECEAQNVSNLIGIKSESTDVNGLLPRIYGKPPICALFKIVIKTKSRCRQRLLNKKRIMRHLDFVLIYDTQSQNRDNNDNDDEEEQSSDECSLKRKKRDFDVNEPISKRAKLEIMGRSSVNDSEIINFGKYKGQSFLTAYCDKKYVESIKKQLPRKKPVVKFKQYISEKDAVEIVFREAKNIKIGKKIMIEPPGNIWHKKRKCQTIKARMIEPLKLAVPFLRKVRCSEFTLKYNGRHIITDSNLKQIIFNDGDVIIWDAVNWKILQIEVQRTMNDENVKNEQQRKMCHRIAVQNQFRVSEIEKEIRKMCNIYNEVMDIYHNEHKLVNGDDFVCSLGIGYGDKLIVRYDEESEIKRKKLLFREYGTNNLISLDFNVLSKALICAKN